MLANIYLHVLDSYWENHKELGIIVRYADDAVIVCRTRKDMRQPFEYCGKKIVGKPCEGESHARFEVAGDGNGLPRHRLTLPQSALVVGRIQPRPSRVSIVR